MLFWSENDGFRAQKIFVFASRQITARSSFDAMQQNRKIMM